jgi:hypothetical protein
MTRTLFLMTMMTLSSAAAWAAPLVDGTKDAAYGPALAVQTVQTAFVDNADELDAAYGLIDAGRVYLMLTGNVNDNFNRLEIFIDSKAGGQNVFDSAGNDNASVMDGLIFDASFHADYHVIVRRGDDGGNNTFDVDFADLGAQSASGYLDILGGLTGTGSTGTGVNGSPIEVGYNDSNVAGIEGNAPNAANQAAALAVASGLEIAFDLGDLGYTGGPIHVMAGINNQDHNFWSNQFLAGLPAPQDFLGSDGQGGFTGTGDIDLTQFRGDQFFTIVPEPSTYLLFMVGLLGAVRIAARFRASERWVISKRG